MNEDEHLVTLRPSQLLNFGWYLLPTVCIFIYPPLAVLAIIAAIYRYFVIATWKYDLNMRTIQEKKGVFNVTMEEIHYYRIKSIMVEEPLWMRFLGLSIVRIISSEQFKPNLVLYGIENGEQVKKAIGDHTYQWRKEYGIKEHDLYNS